MTFPEGSAGRLKLLPLCLCFVACLPFVARSFGQERRLNLDDPLVGITRDAIAATMPSYRHGRMSVEAERGVIRSGTRAPQGKVRGDFEWDGPKQRLQGTYTTYELTAPYKERETQEFISVNADPLSYAIDTTHSVVTIRPPSDALLPLTELRPEICWLRMGSRSFESYFTNERFTSQVDSVNSKQTDSDAYTITITKRDGATITFFCQLTPIPHVVRQETLGTKSGNRGVVRFEWANENGVMVLKSREWARYLGEEKMELYESYRFKNVDLSFRPPNDRFTFNRSALPPGTVVQDKVRDRHYKIGNREVEDVAGSFRRLIDQMKQKGFAREQSK